MRMVVVDGSLADDRGGDVVLSYRRCTAGYGDVPVVHDVDLDVTRGECVALLGHIRHREW